ncbi:calcium-binding protein [Arsenicitalea aurantiaca]|uniref:Calcium-binding protein n=1 Tax=Arsenicitalea aurantiaca TaxID=1783274 RepID=A0A433X871_9HYPH|nr:calcium-binding protein [Arsenicitalea aurantiaca]RUT30259.1 calcium-binding protein [Arsenicitalea aurantiaca]
MTKVLKALGARARFTALHAARAEARHRHRAAVAAASRARAPQPDIVPLEPRIMMDAADLDLGFAAAFNAQFAQDNTEAIRDLLTLAGDLSSEMGALGDRLSGQLGAALAGAVDLYANPDDNPFLLDRTDPFANVFASLGTLGQSFGEAMLADVRDGLGSELQSILDTIRGQLTSELQGKVAGELGALDEGYRAEVDARIAADMAGFGFSDLFNPSALFQTVLGNAAELANSFASVDPLSTEPPADLITSAEIESFTTELRTSLLDTAASAIASGLDQNFVVPNFVLTLEDIMVGDKTIIDFKSIASETDPDAILTDRIGVDILIGNLLPDLNGIYDAMGITVGTMTDWSAFAELFAGTTLSFEIGASSVQGPEIAAGAYHQSVTVTVSGFTGADGATLELGGAPDGLGDRVDGLGLNAGLVGGVVTGMDFARFGLDFGDTALSLSFSTTDYALNAELTRDGSALGADDDVFALSVTEVGGTSAVPFDPEADYALAAIDFRAAIDWGLAHIDGADFVDQGHVALAGTFTLAGGTTGIASSVATTAQLLDGTTDISVGHETELAEIAAFAEGLMALDGTELVEIMRSMASSLDIVFASRLLDLDLPFLEQIDLSKLAKAYQQIVDRLLEPMEVDLSVLGLSAGTNEAIGNLLQLNGLPVDYTDGSVLAALGGETVTFSIAVTVGGVAYPYNVALAIPADGFADLAALGAALKLALAATPTPHLQAPNAEDGDPVPTLADMLFVNVVRGTLELRGSGIEGFAILAAAASASGNVMGQLGLEVRNNTVSTGTPLTGGSLSGLLNDPWLRNYPLSISVERTITTGSGETEESVTDLFRTITLNAPLGGWDAASLAEALEAAFGGVGIEIDVEAGSDDNLVFTVTSTQNVSYTIALDVSKSTVISSLDGLQAFVSGALGAFMPSADVVLDVRTGELILKLPEFGMGFTKEFTQTISGGLGDLASLNLSADFSFWADIAFGFDVGVGLFGLLGTGSGSGLSDNVFLENVALSVALGASAANITGAGKLGIVEVALGSAGNSFEIGAALDVSLVGEKDGVYSERLTIAELLQKANSTAGIAGLIGQLDLVGTVGADGAFARLVLSDLDIAVAGVGGLGSILPSFTASLIDVTAPTDWAYDFGESALTSLITGLGKDDFIDTLYNALILVNQVLGGLSDDLGFLGEEIPVLGISVVDALNFAEEMAAKLQAFKSNPNEGLNQISGALASAFGLGSDELILVWDEGVFYVSLSLGFLEGAGLAYDFSLNLEELLGSFAGSDATLSAMLGVVSSLANVTGEGRLVLDANVGFDLTFGIELPGLAGAQFDAVTAATALTALAGVSQVTFNSAQSGHQGRDIMVSVERKDGPGSPTTYKDYKIELDGAQTVGEALSKIHAALAADGGIAIVLHHADGTTTTLEASDFADGTLTGAAAAADIASIAFVETSVVPTNYAGVNTLFGDTDNAADFEAVDGVVTGNALSGLNLDAAHSFRIIVNGADPVLITIPALPTGDDPRTPADFVAAINAALAATMVSRADIGLGMPVDLPLAKLLIADLTVDGALRLTATNFAEAIGKDPISFALTGLAAGSAQILVHNLGGSNLATALGFAPNGFGEAASGAFTVRGADLAAKTETGGTRAFIVTDAITVGGYELRGTGIALDFIAGVEEGLNMRLALGPLSVDVVNGKALVWSGDEADRNAYIRFGINDAADNYLQGEDAALDGRLYFSAIADLFSSDAPISIGDIVSFEALARLDVVLPLQASLGLLSPDTDRLTLGVNLFETTDSGLVGFLPALVLPSLTASDYVSYEIPSIDFEDFLANLNPYAIINDPLLLANGLDSILKMIDKTLRNVINVMNLPVVGSTLTQALGFFDDISRVIVQPILEAASTPKADGTLPTTVDLLTGLVNDTIKDLFGVEDDVIRAYFNTDQDNPYLVAELYIDAILFSAVLDVGFDLGIPGFNLSVGESSALEFTVNAAINLAFGIDKMGFFFLNDETDPEILLRAIVTTSEGFVATASLAAVGLALTANAIQRGDDTYYGVLIGGEIAIDLFGSLGRDFTAPGTEATDWLDRYDKLVRINELSTSKSATGEGNKTVSIRGEFFVSIDMAMKTSIVNPVTGQTIDELPSAIADFVLDARYEIGGELEMETLEFRNVGLYAGDFLVNNVLPVVEQIYKYVEPLYNIVQFLKTTAIGGYSLYSILQDTVGRIYPAALFIFDALDTLNDVMGFINGLSQSGGIIYFGSFSLLSPASSTGVIDTSNSRAMGNLRPGSDTGTGSSLNLDGAIANKKPGIAFNFLLFEDVSNVLNLITGNLADVELFEVDLTLLDITINIDIVNIIKSAVSFLPGKVIDVLFGGLSASFYFHAEAGITIGYDLYGIAQFLGTGDPVDILDGMYFDSFRPLFGIEASFHARVGINLFVIKAGLELAGNFAFQLDFNDPNQDGKLRFGEIAWVLTDGPGITSLIEGQYRWGLSLSVYFKINLFFTSFGGSWKIIDVGGGGRFGYDFLANPVYLTSDGDGVTTVNVGARAGSAIGGSPDDISDVIYINDQGQIVVNGRAMNLGGTQTLLIYAGEGDNVIDLSGLSSHISFQIFTGSGNDTITVGNNQGIISAGDGDNVIRYVAPPAINAMAGFAMFGALYSPLAVNPLSPTAPAGTGTAAGVPVAGSGSIYGQIREQMGDRDLPAATSQDLVIVLGSGNNRVEMADSTGDMIVVGDGNFEIMHDGKLVAFSEWLQSRFQGKTPDEAGMAEIRDKVNAAMSGYTPTAQTKASSQSVYIETGTGNDIIFGGNGNDTLISHGGNNIVFGGGGDDLIDLSAGSGDNWVEGGAGADIILGGSGNDVLLGWGRFDLDTTDAEYLVALADRIAGLNVTDTAKFVADFRALVEGTIRDDGGDWIEGGAGDDIISGGHGNDILQGGLGNDLIFGGSGNDIIAGGTITITVGGTLVTTPQVNFTPSGAYTISADAIADGDDRLVGVSGSNVLIGGAGDDVLEAGGLNNVMIGDFAELGFTQTGKLILVRSTHIESDLQGDDILVGAGLADVLVGGGGRDLLSGGHGNNILIGDNAEIRGNDLYRGITEISSMISTRDDADVIYTGLTASIIIAGGSRNAEEGDYIETGLLYGFEDLRAKAEGMIIFADYGDVRASGDFSPYLLTTVFDAGDNDVINTGGRDEVQSGSDIIFGGAGDDWISSGDGNDVVFGDTGTYRFEAAKNGSRGQTTLSTDHDATGNTRFGATSAAAGNSSTIAGADTVSAGNGDNIVLGGGGADTISTGSGFDVVLGDLGTVTLYGRALAGAPDLTAETQLAREGTDTEGWSDTIITGGGDAIVIGGDGGDVIRHTPDGLGGEGTFAVIGDFGVLNAAIAGGHARINDTGPDNSGFTLRDMASTHNDLGGNDHIFGGAGREFIIGGAGDDHIELGDGDKIVLGDAGEIDNVGIDGIGVVRSIDFALGGDDTIILGDGHNLVIAGIGDDHVTTGDGDDLVIGDNGEITFTALASQNERRSAMGLATELGGNDVIASGGGADVVMGGNGDDLIDLGAGNDIGIGDWAIVDFDARSLTTQSPDQGGNDRIGGGDGDDIIIGGHGHDVIAGNGGANVVIGDYAGLTWDDTHAPFALKTLTLEAIAHWGNDTLYTNNGRGEHEGLGSGDTADGNSIAIGGRGDDVIHGGEANDFVLGDWGIFDLLDPALHPGQSAFDRIRSVESTEYWVGGHDVIHTYGGRDIVIAGYGDDYVDGGEGNDLIHGDDAIYVNFHDGWELLESRFPFKGGDDVLKGGGGNNIILAGFFNFGKPGAGDLIYGDTIRDWLMGDEGSVLIHNGIVVRFNYLGIAPTDLISTNQLGASAGVLMRPVYERGLADGGYFDPWAVLDGDRLTDLPPIPPLDLDPVADVELYRLDAILRAQILSPDMLALIALYQRGGIGFEDLEIELREAILMALFDLYGYRLPASVEIMLERYMELLAEHLIIGENTIPADGASANHGTAVEASQTAPAGGNRPAAG